MASYYYVTFYNLIILLLLSFFVYWVAADLEGECRLTPDWEPLPPPCLHLPDPCPPHHHCPAGNCGLKFRIHKHY